ncbi:hypothetical protein TrVE_jg7170 [Triparma verrucosa]|uniref:AB hydrolase-1 domain-containing protein n=1 Tax=Triparma verrucosa TaxID=1606542 RepID=A0A9W7CBL8_9STRA|nr:hypothetical protein TrVE_jg7170 [Triparma verrucosa]
MIWSRRRRCDPPLTYRESPAGALVTRSSRGFTHYELHGDWGGVATHKKLVLIHGNVGSTLYIRNLAKSLASTHAVLTYDIYGRGFSSCDSTPHNKSLMVGQLAELLYCLNISGKINLVGYSLGGPIATHFASVYPTKLSSLTLLAPAFRPIPRHWKLLSQLPPARYLIGNIARYSLMNPADYAADWMGLDSTEEARREESRGLFKELYASEFDRFVNEPAFGSSFGNSLASMPWDDVWGPVAELGVGGRGKGINIAVIWGAGDNVVRKEEILEVLREKLGKGVLVEVVEKEGHSLPYERPKLCAELILKNVLEKRD